jgi:hypothetical protein
VTDKLPRLPWQTEPHVNHAAAQEHALAAASARTVDLHNPAVKTWAQTAFDKEIALVERAPEGDRNSQLFKSSANLFEIVAAGALDEVEVTNALERASAPWNWSKAGTTTCEGTIKSGRRHGFDNPRDLSRVGKYTNSFTLDAGETVPTVKLSDTLDFERGFWTQRDSLQSIYLASLSRMCSPWAVLGYCAAIALAAVRPHCTLPPTIGGPGSLNWFCAIAAISGGGKSGSAKVARDLMGYTTYQRNLGSGEGMVDAYVIPADKAKGTPRSLRESVMFVAGEIDNMAALGNRAGSTLNGNLRDAFTGETMGYAYRQASDQHLEAGTYRLTLVVNIQPARAGALLDDAHGGMLQRFMWFPGTDPRVTAQRPLMPGSLDLPSHSAWMYPRELRIPYEAAELVIDERERSMHGESNPLAGHALFIREKFAYALAVLDGRDEMTDEDWRLAGIASRVSDHTRAWVTSELEQIKDDEATEKGRLHGVSQVASEDEKTYRSSQRTNRIAKAALGRIKKASPQEISNSKLVEGIAHRDRPYLPGAMDMLVRSDLVSEGESTNGTGRKGKAWRMVQHES